MWNRLTFASNKIKIKRFKQIHYVWNKVSSKNTESKNISNALCNASISTVQAVGFVQIEKQLRWETAPRVDFNGKDPLMVRLDTSGTVLTTNRLISQGMLPPSIINKSN